MPSARCTALCALQLKEDGNGNVKILSSNAGKEFAAEEISAQVLRKLVDDASKFLNGKVCPSACSSSFCPSPFSLMLNAGLTDARDM